MTPLLLLMYALALAAGLLAVGLAAACVFSAACYLLGGRIQGHSAQVSGPPQQPVSAALAARTSGDGWGTGGDSPPPGGSSVAAPPSPGGPPAGGRAGLTGHRAA